MAGWRARGEGDVDSESTSQASTDGAGEVKVAGIVCRPDAEGTRKSHLGGEKSIIVHKYYQPAIHNHINGCLRTKGRKGRAKRKNGERNVSGYILRATPAYKGG